MKETIVAQRPLAPAIIGLAAVAALFLGVASTVSFFRAVLLLAFGAYWGWKLFLRITRMRLAVTDEKVIVVNLDECVELDLKTVDVGSRNTRYRWPVRWVVEKVSSAFMAEKVNLGVRGVIENMSHFTGDDGKRYYLFGAGGGKDLADRLEVPLVGEVPLVPELREGSDSGKPIMAMAPDSEAGQVFAAMAEKIDVEMAPKKRYTSKLNLLN